MARKTRHNRKNKKRTMKNKTIHKNMSKIHEKNVQENILKKMLEMLNTVKLYHWYTFSLSMHLATDELYKTLNDNIDHFIEQMVGKTGYKAKKICFGCNRILSKKSFCRIIDGYKTYMMDLNFVFDSRQDSDLITIRDEILGSLNQLLYFARLPH